MTSPPEPRSKLLLILSRPFPLAAEDAPTAQDQRIALVDALFTPRPERDADGLSVWEGADEIEQHRLRAAFMATHRAKKDRFLSLEIERSLFEECGVQIHDTPDEGAAPCVRSQHRSLQTHDAEVRRRLAAHIVRCWDCPQQRARISTVRYNPKESAEQVELAAQRCREQLGSLPAAPSQHPWVIELLQRLAS